jgi:hypothetical protein
MHGQSTKNRTNPRVCSEFVTESSLVAAFLLPALLLLSIESKALPQGLSLSLQVIGKVIGVVIRPFTFERSHLPCPLLHRNLSDALNGVSCRMLADAAGTAYLDYLSKEFA